MAADLIIAPEAVQDIDEAYCWYECQRAGLVVVSMPRYRPSVARLKCMRRCSRITAAGWFGDSRLQSSTSLSTAL